MPKYKCIYLNEYELSNLRDSTTMFFKTKEQAEKYLSDNFSDLEDWKIEEVE